MNSELLFQIVEMIEAEAQSRPSGMEFEMAYQARVAIDRIKRAVKRSEQAGSQPDQNITEPTSRLEPSRSDTER